MYRERDLGLLFWPKTNIISQDQVLRVILLQQLILPLVICAGCFLSYCNLAFEVEADDYYGEKQSRVPCGLQAGSASSSPSRSLSSMKRRQEEKVAIVT